MNPLAWVMRLLRGGYASPPVRLPSPDELVLLARPAGLGEATLFRDMLEAEGIHSLVKNRDAVSVNYGGTGPWWAYELWVLRRDLVPARGIIDSD